MKATTPIDRVVVWHLATLTPVEATARFPPPPDHELKALSALVILPELGEVGHLEVAADSSERELLHWFSALLVSSNPNSTSRLVGLWSQHFGSPVIRGAALRCGVCLPRPFRVDAENYDLAEWVESYLRGKGGFDAATEALCIPPRPALDVARALRKHQVKKVQARLKLDVGIIAMFWIRVALVMGQLKKTQAVDLTKKVWAEIRDQRSGLIRHYFRRAVKQAKLRSRSR
jgi:hypothetical protein